MTYKKFFLDSVMPPSDCPDVTFVCAFECDAGTIQKELRVIKTPTAFGIVIDDIYLSLASGKDRFARGDYVLFKEDDRYGVGINEDLYL